MITYSDDPILMGIVLPSKHSLNFINDLRASVCSIVGWLDGKATRDEIDSFTHEVLNSGDETGAVINSQILQIAQNDPKDGEPLDWELLMAPGTKFFVPAGCNRAMIVTDRDPPAKTATVYQIGTKKYHCDQYFNFRFNKLSSATATEGFILVAETDNPSADAISVKLRGDPLGLVDLITYEDLPGYRYLKERLGDELMSSSEHINLDLRSITSDVLVI